MNENLYQAKQDFLAEWPLSRIHKMTLEEYTNLDKTSFCYWLEAKTSNLGSIWGGSSYKFGIYKRRDRKTQVAAGHRITDGEYAWFEKYGATRNAAFGKVKTILISIIEAVQNDELEEIDAVDLGDAYKWKIAFLYGNWNVVNIFKNESLDEAARSLNYKEADTSYSALNRYILKHKEATLDYFEFTSELWKKTFLANPTRYWLYAPGEQARLWDEFYKDGIIGLGWDALGDLEEYKNKTEIQAKLQELEGVTTSKKNDTTANYDFYKSISIGDVIIAKKGTSELLGYGLVVSDYYYDEERNSSQKCRKVDWKRKGNWKGDFNLPIKTLTDITKYPNDDANYNKYYEKLMSIMEEKIQISNVKDKFVDWMVANTNGGNYFEKQFGSNRSRFEKELSEYEAIYKTTFDGVLFDLNLSNLSQEIAVLSNNIYSKANAFYEYSKNNASDRPKAILGKNNYLKFLNENFMGNDSTDNRLGVSLPSDYPLNQILYGPPGTGKTYHTVLEAAKIVTRNESITYDEALKVFNENLGTQIEFITFHQNYSYEDFIQGLRPDTGNGTALTFEKKDGVFKRIADRAMENLNLASKAPEELSNEILFYKALEAFKDSILDTEDKYSINDSVFIFEIDEEAFRYTGTNWEKHSNGIRMKFSDLKEFYRNDVKTRKDIKALTTISGLANQHATYYLLVYQAILKFLPDHLEQQVQIKQKNYVIIIDEINRANISRVFGELITLIEEDKRSHGKIPMRVTLPSGDTFIVPSNLYLIGTMNTADKSIALLDIALRRRFEFVPMYPDATLDTVHDKEILTDINTAILQRKSHDFTIGHAYFMGDNYDRKKTLNHKVIPLLLEYFMNDEKEVIAILKEANISIGSWPLKVL
ncbi:AAA family ATPase [Flavobacterium sp. SM2513]|uniref:AAA family ATPase n=1 Tax=Flavobacterium sp. SM2513 TaxID=3424766 RepID=UPI003D7F4E24